MNWIYVFVFMVMASVSAQESPDLDRVSLAAVLIRDGYYARAKSTLDLIKAEDSGVDWARVRTLKGLIDLKQKRFEPAIQNFEAVLSLKPENRVIYVYLAQAHYGAKSYPKALEALELAKEEATKRPKTSLLKSTCLWKMGQKIQAWDVLKEAGQRHPEVPDFDRQKILYLVDLQLFQQALEFGQRFLVKYEAQPKDYIALGMALRVSQQFERAKLLLEQAKLQFPKNEEILIELATLYLKTQDTLSAAFLFEQLSHLNPKYLVEASELYRRAGRLQQAIYLNAQIRDQEKKLKQRLAILIETQDFEGAQGMSEMLSRVGLLKDEDINYALAFAHFQTGQYRRVEKFLTPLTREDLFRKAIALRENMNRCKQEPLKCQL